MPFQIPMGVSEFNALQFNVRGRLQDLGVVRGVTFVSSYQYGQLEANINRQEFISAPFEQDNARKFVGPVALDRRHSISTGSTWELPYGFSFSNITQVRSQLPVTPKIPVITGGADEIFFTDLTGDGTVGSFGGQTGEILPGTSIGQFGRAIGSVSELNALITNFNNNIVGTLTPAGQALVDAGLFTSAQMTALGAVVNNGLPLPLAPSDQVFPDWFLTSDVRLAWKFTVEGGVGLELSVDVFNVFNFANFDAPGNLLFGELDGSLQSINGTPSGQRPNPVVRGSGAFEQGIPRSVQLGIRVTW